MPRRLRVFVDGGIYHVSNRFASGEPIFANPEVARRLIANLGREHWSQSTKDRTSALGKGAHTVTSRRREGVRQRLDDEEFARRYETLDRTLAGGAK